MPASLRTPREAWVEAGLHALAEGGPASVRVETLARSLGVTKGGFYWHFSGRDELLGAMLETWERTLVDRAIEDADRGGGDGRTRLRRLFAAASRDGGLLALELAVRDWARHDDDVRSRVARVDDRRLAYLRPLFREFCDDPADADGRSLLTLALFVHESSVEATHGRRSRRSVAAAAVRHLLR